MDTDNQSSRHTKKRCNLGERDKLQSVKTFRLRTFLRFWLPVLLWAGLILAVSSNSNPFVIVPEAVQASDETLGRFAHVAEYAVLSFLVSRALTQNNRMSLASVLMVGFGCLTFGLLDELCQSRVPGRAFQLLDLELDLTGIALGIAAYNVLKS